LPVARGAPASAKVVAEVRHSSRCQPACCCFSTAAVAARHREMPSLAAAAAHFAADRRTRRVLGHGFI